MTTVTFAHNVRSPAEVDAVVEEARRANPRWRIRDDGSVELPE